MTERELRALAAALLEDIEADKTDEESEEG